MTSISSRVAAIGEIMVELSVGDGRSVETRVNFAGDTANTAVYLRREAGDEVSVSYVTVVGQDALSERLVDFLREEGLDTSTIGRHPSRPPGLYAISIDERGERSFVYWRDNSAARTLFGNAAPVDEVADEATGELAREVADETADEELPDDSFDALAAFDLIYHSGITLAILPPPVRARFLTWLDGYRRNGGRVAFDSNYRPMLWESREAARRGTARAWSSCDIALPSIDDEMALFGDADESAVLARLRGYGLTDGALKRGGLGPVPIDARVETPSLPPATEVVDTTAAGDSFNGAFLAARLAGSDIETAMRRGHRCAMRVIARRGAIVPREPPRAGGASGHGAPPA